MTEVTDDAIADAIRDMARERTATFCPSEVARRLADDWRPLMPDIRRVAADLSDIRATQKGQKVDVMTARGPIRLAARGD